MKFYKAKATILMTFFFIFSASAQFNTLTRNGIVREKTKIAYAQNATYQIDTSPSPSSSEKIFASPRKNEQDRKSKSSHQKNTERKSPKFGHSGHLPDTILTSLPLTLPNLVAVLRHYKIKYPKIVLAQAIQETGWLRSNVCLTKNNLFGLTNPRTGQYFEFSHWSESVRAYGTTVQYKYRGGDYFRWLEDIGYAGDPNYTTSLKKIIQHYLTEQKKSSIEI